MQLLRDDVRMTTRFVEVELERGAASLRFVHARLRDGAMTPRIGSACLAPTSTRLARVVVSVRDAVMSFANVAVRHANVSTAFASGRAHFWYGAAHR